MVLGRPKTYAKKVVKKWSPPKGSRPKKKPKTIQNTPLGAAKRPPGGYFAEFGFLLGPAPFWRGPFFDHFSAYVLGRPITIILLFFGFGLSRGHGLYKSPRASNNIVFPQCLTFSEAIDSNFSCIAHLSKCT